MIIVERRKELEIFEMMIIPTRTTRCKQHTIHGEAGSQHCLTTSVHWGFLTQDDKALKQFANPLPHEAVYTYTAMNIFITNLIY
jgi:hypothetical protein